MKKLFVGMFAFMMLMGLATSYNSKSDANNAEAETSEEVATEDVRPLAEVIKDAKENGANWSIDEWKAAYREMAINVKPAMIEWKTVTEEFDKDPTNAEAAKKVESLLTNSDLHGMEEFIAIAEATENGKIVTEDDDFEKAMKEELGLPDLD
jgi:hypothetical protein